MIHFLDELKKHSDAVMFKKMNGVNITCWTYFDYISDMRKIAYKLEEIFGNIKGKHIGIISTDGYEYLVMLGAIIFSRAVAVPINENETEENITFALQNADVSILIKSDEIKKGAKSGFKTISKESLFSSIVEGGMEKDISDFNNSEENELALILYTSGTTSLSKGVALSAGNLFLEKRTELPLAYVDGSEDSVNALAYTNFPYYHLGGIMVWLSWTTYGCTICMSEDPGHVLTDLENNNIDFAAVTPALLKVWVNCINRGRMDRLGHVRHLLSGGAPIEPDTIRFFIANGITVVQYYGMTETGNAITCNFDMEKHIESVGKSNDNSVVFCEDGEICAKTWSSMLGYYNNPTETEEHKKNGVIYTGDLGYIDDEGYIYITGRKKNLIILSGGENVSPEEIEAGLYRNEHIKECLVYEKNDRIAADIYAPGQDEKRIKDYVNALNKEMPAYKKIYFVKLRADEFEKTASGKIKR